MTKLVVRIRRPPRHGFLDHLHRRLAPEVSVTTGEEGACDVLVDGVPERGQLEGVAAVVIPYAGVPEKTRELLREFPGVTLHNLHHNAAPTAELAMALFLAAAKSIVPLDRGLRKNDWRPRYEERDDFLCDGKTALVLGLGAIGGRVAAACRGLGMRVVATRRGGPFEDGVHPPHELPQLLTGANAVFVCLPWTPETEGLLGSKELALLPDRAVLVNVGRGPIVEEDALYEELKSGRISAGLDVWYRYPDDDAARAATPPATHPFHELSNIVMSPHRGGLSDGTEPLRAAALAESLNAAARGEPLPNRVDLERGY